MTDDSDIESIKTCDRCGHSYHLFDIQGKCKGRFICRNCFPVSVGDICDHPKNAQLASHSWINDKRVDLYSEMSNVTDKMFPNPWHYYDNKLAEEKETFFSKTKTHISMQPINCPLTYCRKALAVSGIPFHFFIDHKSTYQINTRLDATNGADFLIKELEQCEVTCVMILSLVDDLNKPLKVSSPSKQHLCGDANFLKVKPVILILCSKTEYLVPVPVELNDDCVGEYYTTTSKINIWAASNVPVLFNSTLCLTSHGKRRRMKFYGPIFPLKDKNQPLYEDGQGLVLNEDHINFFAKQDKCVLEVVVHKNTDGDSSD